MAVDMYFSRKNAEKAGVEFTPLWGEVVGYYDQSEPILEERLSGYKILLPNGINFMSWSDTSFQCKNINQEAKHWFLENVEGARLSM